MSDPRTHPSFLPGNRVSQHVVFWTVIYFFDVFVFGWDTQNYTLYFRLVLYEMPGQMTLAYVMMYACIPLFFKGRYIECILVFLLTFIAVSFSAHALILYFSDYYKGDIDLFSFSKFLVRGFYLFANAAIAVIIKLTRMWYQNEIRISEMQSIRLQSELKMLKDQVNPHFMFNTLNNLYGLVARNPEHAREMILGLSRILHYMLHESNTDFVPLRKEIGCIRDYIALEKVRYSGNLSVSFNCDEKAETMGIFPLVLFPFVENSFKHGVSETIHATWVNIDLSTYRNDFVFKVENPKTPASGNGRAVGGIGLNNVRRRLELLYGTDHTLQIVDGNETYLVVLKIRLSRMQTFIKTEHEADLSNS